MIPREKLESLIKDKLILFLKEKKEFYEFYNNNNKTKMLILVTKELYEEINNFLLEQTAHLDDVVFKGTVIQLDGIPYNRAHSPDDIIPESVNICILSNNQFHEMQEEFNKIRIKLNTPLSDYVDQDNMFSFEQLALNAFIDHDEASFNLLKENINEYGYSELIYLRELQNTVDDEQLNYFLNELEARN